jgi:hypothetical protein
MYPYAVGENVPVEVDSKEAAQGPHKFDADACLKSFFDAVIRQEVEEVIYIAPDVFRVVGICATMPDEDIGVTSACPESDGE